MSIEAPPIRRAMDQWTALGGRNSGIVANLDTHDSGFHLSVNQLAALGKRWTDYSVVRDPAGADGPFVNLDYACAGDFWHGDDPRLLEHHRVLLARLMAGDPSLSMICEFIGQPWADQPVKYWARWRGVTTLSNYTGEGHGTWSHISWYRSRANQDAPLWTPEGKHDMIGLKYGDGKNGGDIAEEVKALQYTLEAAGYELGTPDGFYGDKTAAAVKACCGGPDGKLFVGIHYSRLLVQLVTKHAVPGPRGPQGSQGIQGVKGDKGDPGLLEIAPGTVLTVTVKE